MGYSSRFRKGRDARGNDSNTHARIGDHNFNISTSELVVVLRCMGDKVWWPKEMRSDPSKTNPDFWCKFHYDHGHRTSDCRLLHGEVEHLLKQGYLIDMFSQKGRQSYMKNRQEPPKPPSPKRIVSVITGGDEVNGVLDGDSITFDDEDADGLMIPHNNALVISLLVYDTNVKRVLIDPSSSVNIILLTVVNEMQDNDKVIPMARSLSGFDNSSVITKGEVVLTTFAEGVVKDTKFQVIDADMAYNIILRRPRIHDMDVIPSTLHQLIKFPLQWGIHQLCGDQQASRSINLVVITSTVTNDADAKWKL
nr:uncharacterized protein LOC104116345 [Nicotiana tomentosiformis]